MPTRYLLFLSLVFLIACSSSGYKLVPTPNLFVNSDYDPYQNLPKHKQKTTVEIMYVTDRSSKKDKKGLSFTAKRSRKLVYGTYSVKIGQMDSWEKLRHLSLTKHDERITMTLKKINIEGQFPMFDNKPKSNTKENAFICKVNKRLKMAKTKECYVYIHGFNNQFADAAITMAQLWHFIGRKGVAFIYSWPAGRLGVLGYMADRESGEFTVFHLKQFLKALSKTNAEKIHILAHSRGTDVTCTALRELHIELKAQKKSLQKELKLENLILAAADIDVGVFDQRIIAEGIHLQPKRLTLYLGEGDRALNISEIVNASIRRLGLLSPKDLWEYNAKDLKEWDSVNFIYVPERLSFLGHSYFVDNPAVISDLILLLRDDKKVGAKNGRPLEPDQSGMWILRRDYPQFQKIAR